MLSINKQTIRIALVIFAAAISLATANILPTSQASAAGKYDCPKGQVYSNPAKKCVKNTFGCGTDSVYDSVDGCVAKPGTTTGPKLITCPDGKTTAVSKSLCPPAPSGDGDCSKGIQSCSLVSQYIKPFIKFLSVLVGLAVVFSIIVGGIQYASSAGDPAAVTAAKNRIRNAIIALVTYIFLFAMLNFLIPGGLG